jgi:hypothetical protein
MGTSHNMRKGTRSGRSTRLEPQRDWDSFLLAAGNPKVSKGKFHLCVETMISHLEKADVEQVTLGEKSIGRHVSLIVDTPEKRSAKEKQGNWGDPGLKRAAREIDSRETPYACYSMEPVEDICWESIGRMRGTDFHGH